MIFVHVWTAKLEGRILNLRPMDGGEEGLCEKFMEKSRAKKKKKYETLNGC